jgi:aldehyde dehydrogenase (NAD+)
MTITLSSDTLFIGGEWVPRPGASRISLVAPATEEVYGETPLPTAEDADLAVDAARRAFERGVWSSLPVEERVAVIRRAVDLVMPHLDDIAFVSAHEMGAPIAVTSMMGGVVRRVVEGMCEQASSAELREHGSGLWDYEIQHDPIGVVVDIVPWNSPFSGTMMKSAQALLAGCSVISKPPPTAPHAVLAWAKALEQAGLPAGVYSILAATPEVSERLVSHPAVDLVVFTGGTEVGRRVAELCGRNLKRVVLELGGKSAAVVLDDADLELSVSSVASGVYFNSGQICSALTRMIVPRHALDDTVDLLRAKASGVVIGDPLDPQTSMGPMATEAHYRRVLDRVQAGVDEGAELLFGGVRPTGVDRGWYVEPALFLADNEMTVAREEIFGPVVAVIVHDGEEDAVRIANDSPYGLGGAVFSTDEARAHTVASRLATGSVTINGYSTNLLAARDPHKASGIGSVTGLAGFESFHSRRLLNLRAAAGAWKPGELFSSAADR